ncbi:MAG: CoA transferase [Chloroflexi bacterium]|nr:CoA transferase [Chloroflexota bacterium]
MLEGIRVVELAQWGFVPSCAAILADWGADVIKIEHPRTGDPMRKIGSLGVGLPELDGFNYMFEQLNRGKRSIGLDVSRPSGREVFFDLLKKSDVLVTSFLEPARERLGGTYDDVAKVNPRLIYARGHGQGQRGPDADQPGFDVVSYWSRGGIGHLVSTKDGRFIKPWGGSGDLPGGMFLAGGIAAALFRRSVTGRGGLVDMSLLGAAIWSSGVDIVPAALAGQDMPKHGDEPRGNALIGHYMTKDGRYIYLNMMESDRYWPSFCKAMRREELAQDRQYATAQARGRHCLELWEIIKAEFKKATLAEWSERLRASGCVWGPVQTPLEASRDVQVIKNSYMVEHPTQAKVKLASTPVQFNDGKVTFRRGAPLLGEHTEAILGGLGYDGETIRKLKFEGIVA